MTQIILQIEDTNLIPEIEKTLALLKGVSFKTITEVPSKDTLKAIKQAKEGKVTHCKSSAEMFEALSK